MNVHIGLTFGFRAGRTKARPLAESRAALLQPHRPGAGHRREVGQDQTLAPDDRPQRL